MGVQRKKALSRDGERGLVPCEEEQGVKTYR